MSLLHLLEPEESIGNLWHSLVGDRSNVARFPEAAVTFEQIEAARKALQVQTEALQAARNSTS